MCDNEIVGCIFKEFLKIDTEIKTVQRRGGGGNHNMEFAPKKKKKVEWGKYVVRQD